MMDHYHCRDKNGKMTVVTYLSLIAGQYIGRQLASPSFSVVGHSLLVWPWFGDGPGFFLCVPPPGITWLACSGSSLEIPFHGMLDSGVLWFEECVPKPSPPGGVVWWSHSLERLRQSGTCLVLPLRTTDRTYLIIFSSLYCVQSRQRSQSLIWVEVTIFKAAQGDL